MSDCNLSRLSYKTTQTTLLNISVVNNMVVIEGK